MKKKPKPSVTIDERGIVLHVTDSEGNGVAIPLEPATVLELAAALERAKAKLRTPEGRGVVLQAIAKLAAELGKKG